jgi:hypothetical protein
LEQSDRVNRVRFCWPPSFHIGDGKGWFAGNGEPNHLEPVDGWGQIALQLVWRITRWDEQDLVEREALSGLGCNGEVAVMDGVKRSAE